MIIHNDDNTYSLISGDKWKNKMSKPVAEVIEWEETYGHTFKKRTVSTVKWLENVEVGTKLYTHPVKQLSYGRLGELFLQAEKNSFGKTRIKPDGGISLRPDIEEFAYLIIKEVTE